MGFAVVICGHNIFAVSVEVNGDGLFGGDGVGHFRAVASAVDGEHAQPVDVDGLLVFELGGEGVELDSLENVGHGVPPVSFPSGLPAVREYNLSNLV